MAAFRLLAACEQTHRDLPLYALFSPLKIPGEWPGIFAFSNQVGIPGLAGSLAFE
jgi:hypothetical protein